MTVSHQTERHQRAANDFDEVLAEVIQDALPPVVEDMARAAREMP